MIRITILTLGLFGLLLAHGFHWHSQEQKAVVIHIEDTHGHKGAFMFYDLYAPDDERVYQRGQSDRNGMISFIPTQAGLWRLEAVEESEHGMHAVGVSITVDEALVFGGYNRPFFERYAGAIAGVALLWAVVASFLAYRRKGITADDTNSMSRLDRMFGS